MVGAVASGKQTEQTVGHSWKGLLMSHPAYTTSSNNYSFTKRNKLLWKMWVLKACFLMDGWRRFCLAKSKHFRNSTLVGNWSSEPLIGPWAFHIVSHWIIYGRARVTMMTSGHGSSKTPSSRTWSLYLSEYCSSFLISSLLPAKGDLWKENPRVALPACLWWKILWGVLLTACFLPPALLPSWDTT